MPQSGHVYFEEPNVITNAELFSFIHLRKHYIRYTSGNFFDLTSFVIDWLTRFLAWNQIKTRKNQVRTILLSLLDKQVFLMGRYR